MGMASNKLFSARVDYFCNTESAILSADFSDHQNQVEKISELLAEVVWIVFVYRGDDFSAFLLQVFFQGCRCLFLIPWAPVFAAQLGYGIEQMGEVAGIHNMSDC